jgi:polysaccharide export outer membrane protein
MRQVAVFGAVSTPGTYEIPANKCDLAAAISAAGGLTKDADTTVEIRKPKPPESHVQTVGYQHPDSRQSDASNRSGESIAIDLTRPEDSRQEQFDLIDGSIVMVREKKPRSVFVTGMVRSPKQVEIPNNSDLRLLDAITLAGGRSTPFAQKIKVIRTLDGRATPIYIKTSYSEAKEDGTANLRLAAGDVVSMEETPGLLFFDAIRSVVNFGIGASVPLF